MIFKFKYILVFAIILAGFYSSAFAQKISREETKYVMRDIHGKPICYETENKTYVYFRENGERLIVPLFAGVEFNGGRDSLTEYLKKEYYKNSNSNGYKYELLEYFFILLDKNLEIQEVRIADGGSRGGKGRGYKSPFGDALKNTTGMWYKTVDNKEWYLYLHFYFAY